MASNPFMLGLLGHALIDVPPEFDGVEACVLRHVVCSLRKQHNREAESNELLAAEHLRVLGRLSYRLLLENPPALNAIQADVLERTAETWKLCAQAMMQSRFLTSTFSNVDEYRFVNSPLQVYFAAQHVCEELNEEQQSEFVKEAIWSKRQFEVLLYAVSLNCRIARQCRQHYQGWILKEDTFHMLLLRLARVAIAARWRHWETLGVVADLRTRLWQVIQDSQDEHQSHRFVDVLFELDQDFLCKKAKSADLDRRVLQSIMDRITTGHASEEKLTSVDGSNVGQEQALLSNCRHRTHDWQQRNDLIDTLLNPATTAELRNLIQNSIKSRGDRSLEPSICDRLMRRMVATDPTDSHVLLCLQLLDGEPAKAGASVIAEVALSDQVGTATRAAAIEVASTTGDPITLPTQSSRAFEDQAPEVRLAFLQMAASSAVVLPLAWLERQLGLVDDPPKLRRLLMAYCRSYPLRCDSERIQMQRFMSSQILDSLKHERTARILPLCDWLFSLPSADADKFIDDRVENLLAHRLVQFIANPEASDLACITFAAKLAALDPSEGSHIHLRRALDTAMDAATKENANRAEAWFAIATSIAECLLRIDPGILLEYEASHHPIRSVLHRATIERGWFVMRDRILDCEGVEIAVRRADSTEPQCYSTPEAIQEVLEGLPHRQRTDLLSYWYMVSEGELDYVHTDKETIHHAMCTVMESDLHSSLSERLWSCYRDGTPPKFSTWKKNLTRVVERYEKQPELFAHLQQVGLGINRRKPR